MNLESIASDALTSRLYHLRRQERHLLVEFLECLAELERRRTYLELAFPSSFKFCTDHLGLTKASAFRRTKAAELLTRFPQVADYLRDGRLCLTTLVELRDLLDETNATQFLDRAAGKTEEEVKLLVATLQPQPAPRDLFRRVPGSRPPTPAGSGSELTVSSGPELLAASGAREPTAGSGPELTTVRAERPRGTLAPISEELRVLRVTVGQEFAEELTRVKAALSHRVPDGNLEAVLRICLQTTLLVLEKRQRGTGRKSSRPARTDTRYIATAIRREVRDRDGARCAFVAADGRRCAETHRLELHHVIPFARGGPSTAENLGLRCKAHNLHAAREDFGAEKVDRFAGRSATDQLALPALAQSA